MGSAFAGGIQNQNQSQNPLIPKGWNFYFFGISYHLREGWKDAPRKLDNSGRWVFNPGIGIGAEWLKSPFERGFRPIAEIGWFQDCGDKSLYHANVGLRYRYITDGGWSLGFTLGGGIYYAQDWEEGEYKWTGLPIAFLSLGHTLNLGGYRLLPEINITYVPENDSISATSDTDLIFTFITLSF